MAALTSPTSMQTQGQRPWNPHKPTLEATTAIHTNRLTSSLTSSLCHHPSTSSPSLRQIIKRTAIRRPLHTFRPLRLCTPARRHNTGTIHIAPIKRPSHIPRVHHIHRSLSRIATNPTSRPQSLSLRQSTHKPTDLIASKPKVLIAIIPVCHREATNTPITQGHRRACRDTTVILKPLYSLFKEARRTTAILEIITTQQQFLTLTLVTQAILLSRCPFMI